jgi:predicted outer membrane repeat protein
MKSCALIVTAIVLLATPAAATVIRVDVGGTGDYATISEGIAAAASGDTVLVLPGTYSGPSNRDMAFLGKNILLHSLSGPDETIVDCEHAAPGFLFFGGEDTTAVVDGLTIKNGASSLRSGGAIAIGGSSSPKLVNCIFQGNSGGSGGAVDCSSTASPRITGCIFLENSAIGTGGALFVGSGSPRVTGCSFMLNSAEQKGGGVGCYNGSPVIRDCFFGQNTAAGEGGGACYFYNATGTHLARTAFSNNQAPSGAGLFAQSGSVIADTCDFVGNVATGYGGGIYTYGCYPLTFTGCTFSQNESAAGGGVFCLTGGPLFRRCFFFQNTAASPGANGGGAYFYGASSASLYGCTFVNNTAASAGGAIFAQSTDLALHGCAVGPTNTATYWGGGVSMTTVTGLIDSTAFVANTAATGAGLRLSDASPSVTACVFSGNQGTEGGGLEANFGSSPTVSFCVFEGNTVSSMGSGALLRSSTASVTNCTLVKNEGGGALFCDYLGNPTVSRCIVAFTAGSEGVRCNDGTPEVTHCYVFGNALGDSLCGDHHDNVVADPRFCGLAAADYTLCANSPCLAANNSWGQLIGAREQGCSDCDSAVGPTSWGRIKALYR